MSMEEKERTTKEKVFKDKTKNFKTDMEALCGVYGVKAVAAISFNEEDRIGTGTYGGASTLEQLGLAKTVEQHFLQ